MTHDLVERDDKVMLHFIDIGRSGNIWVGGSAGQGATRFIMDYLATAERPLTLVYTPDTTAVEYANLKPTLVHTDEFEDSDIKPGVVVFDNAFDLWEAGCRGGDMSKLWLLMDSSDHQCIIRAQRAVGPALTGALSRCDVRALAGRAPRSTHECVLGTDALMELSHRPGDIAISDTEGALGFVPRRA